MELGASVELVQRDGGKLERQPAGRRHAALDRIEQLGEVAVAGIELGVREGDADHWARQLVARVAHRVGKRAPHVDGEVGIAVDLQVAQKATLRARFARLCHDPPCVRLASSLARNPCPGSLAGNPVRPPPASNPSAPAKWPLPPHSASEGETYSSWAQRASQHATAWALTIAEARSWNSSHGSPRLRTSLAAGNGRRWPHLLLCCQLTDLIALHRAAAAAAALRSLPRGVLAGQVGTDRRALLFVPRCACTAGCAPHLLSGRGGELETRCNG